MVTPREFGTFTAPHYDVQANIEAKLRVVTAIHICADRFALGEAGADALQEIQMHVASLRRLNATGSDLMNALTDGVRSLIVASSSPPPTGV
jgi:hypothetical protein